MGIGAVIAFTPLEGAMKSFTPTTICSFFSTARWNS